MKFVYENILLKYCQLLSILNFTTYWTLNKDLDINKCIDILQSTNYEHGPDESKMFPLVTNGSHK